MKTSQKKEPLPTIKRCIEYIESCGWKLEHRGRNYLFYNELAHVGQKYMSFTLKEIREIYLNGW